MTYLFPSFTNDADAEGWVRGVSFLFRMSRFSNARGIFFGRIELKKYADFVCQYHRRALRGGKIAR